MPPSWEVRTAGMMFRSMSNRFWWARGRVRYPPRRRSLIISNRVVLHETTRIRGRVLSEDHDNHGRSGGFSITGSCSFPVSPCSGESFTCRRIGWHKILLAWGFLSWTRWHCLSVPCLLGSVRTSVSVSGPDLIRGQTAGSGFSGASQKEGFPDNPPREPAWRLDQSLVQPHPEHGHRS